MKKLIYGGLLLAAVGIGFVGCKKISEPNFKNDFNTNVSTKSSSSNFDIRNNVLVFDSWEAVVSMVDELEGQIDENVDLFDNTYSDIINDLALMNSEDGALDNGFSWEAENAIDSFEMSKGWEELQPLIDFENNNNFYSLRKKIDSILYNENAGSLSLEQRSFYNTFPFGDGLATLFNSDGLIGINDSVYKILHNNVWLSCHFDDRNDLNQINRYNYQEQIGSEKIRIYNVNEKGSSCYANTRRTDDKRGGSGNKWRVYGVLTVTNVPVLNGKFIKGKTVSERQNHRGKWRRRRNSIQVSGTAQMRWGNACNINFQRITNGAFNSSHSNRSSRIGRYRLESIFRVKKHEMYTYHRIGTGSNQITLFILLD